MLLPLAHTYRPGLDWSEASRQEITGLLCRSRGPRAFGPYSAAFAGALPGAGWEVELLELKPASVWDAIATDGGLIYYAMTLGQNLS